MPSADVDYPEIAQLTHRLLRERGITCDVIHPSAELSAYAVVIVPTLYLVTDDDAASIRAAAERGAQVLVTYVSGLVDENDHVRLGGYPGAFTDLLGVRVEEFNPLLPGDSLALARGTGARWSEFATATDAEVLISDAAGPVAGSPALTRRRVGSGAGWYAGTRFDDDTWRSVLGEVIDAAGIEPAAYVPAGVEAVRRRAGGRSWLFLLNHGAGEARVAVDGYDLVSAGSIDSEIVLPPGGCAVIREG